MGINARTIEGGRVEDVIDASIVRIVVEPDEKRMRKPPFSPIRQSVFWLRTGENANATEVSETRKPFSILLPNAQEQDAFSSGLQGALSLYGERFSHRTGEGQGTVIVGDYSHEKHGSPAVVIRNSGSMQYVEHMWIGSQPKRERRLK